jgi:adenine specific DNA methylase Mod
MPSLNWIGKEKIVNHDKDVPFRLLRKNKKYSLGKSENLIVEGDNLEALKALMPFYYGKIKCIYIDPPYNTGNEKWVYNDKVNSPKIKEWLGKVVGPEGEDLSRHDKWLCMMYPRLKLLKDLLREDGVIFVSIDDNEHCNLRMVMDEIFGEENFIANLVWKKKYTGGKHANYFVDLHEYIMVYAKSKKQILKFEIDRPDKEKEKFVLTDGYMKERGRFYIRPLKSNLELRPTLIYPIKLPNGKEIKTQWLVSRPTFERLINEERIMFRKKQNGDYQVYMKYYENDRGGKVMVPSIIDFVSNNDAKIELKNIFRIKEGRDNVFYTAKPMSLIKYFISFGASKDDIILDSFSGSGTTAHSVLDLNKEDGGNRKFILVEMEKNIAKNITAERVKRVAQGYSYKTSNGKMEKVEGLGGGFEYVELGEPLFDNNGAINKDVSFEDMAQYIYFTETHTNLEKKNILRNYLGELNNSHYFLLFDGIGKNVLDRKFLKEIKDKSGPKIIYADKCLLDADVLEKHQIIFKQIPYEVKVY